MSPAPLGARAGAWLLDLLITPILPVALYLGLGVAFHPDDIPRPIGFPIAGALLTFHLLYAPVLLQRAGRHAGQTLGKQALGVRVVAGKTGGPVRSKKALLREIVGRSLLGFIPLYLVADLLLAFLDRPDRRAIHDIIADTRVVRADER